MRRKLPALVVLTACAALPAVYARNVVKNAAQRVKPYDPARLPIGRVVQNPTAIYASPERKRVYAMVKGETRLVLPVAKEGGYTVLMEDGRLGWVSAVRVVLIAP